MRYLFIIITSFFIVEFLAYLDHRFVAHLGYAGDTIRVNHQCHHETRYPPGNLESKIYKTANDTWPWLPPVIIVASILYFIIYKRYKLIEKDTMIIFLIYSIIHIIITLGFFHYSFHIKDHFLNKYSCYRKIKQLHFMHHYKKCNYSIVFPFIMDKLFGTYCGLDENKNKEDIFNGLDSKCEDRIKCLDF